MFSAIKPRLTLTSLHKYVHQCRRFSLRCRGDRLGGLTSRTGSLISPKTGNQSSNKGTTESLLYCIGAVKEPLILCFRCVIVVYNYCLVLMCIFYFILLVHFIDVSIIFYLWFCYIFIVLGEESVLS